MAISAWAAQLEGVGGGHCPPLLGPGGTGGTMKIAPPHFWDPGVQGGTMKMIFLTINLCFCTRASILLKPMAHIPPSTPHAFLPTPSFLLPHPFLHLPHPFLPIPTPPVPLPLEVGTLKSS